VRGQHLFDAERPGFGDHHVHHFLVQVAVLFGFKQLLDFQLFVEDKVDVPAVCDLLCHVPILP
jgi:hypothetical protein